MLVLAICDNDSRFCTSLERILHQYEKEHGCAMEVSIYYSVEKLLEDLEKKLFDMIFLDICLKKSSGIKTGEIIRKTLYGKKVRITFISKFQDYAAQLFHLHPFDFLPKPFEKEGIYRVMKELSEYMDENDQIFEYQDTEGMHRVAYKDIQYFYSTAKIVHIVTERGNMEFRGQLREVDRNTKGYFMLIHKSFLINRAYIEHYKYERVVMKNQAELNISKSNQKRVRQLMLKPEEI